MTKNLAFLMFVSPAKAGVQLEDFKRKGSPTNLENTKNKDPTLNSLVMPLKEASQRIQQRPTPTESA